MNELKRCPFCGSPLELTEKGSSIGPVNKKPYWEFTDVECTNEDCPFSMKFDTKKYTKSQIIEFLNSRNDFQIEDLQAEIKQLKKTKSLLLEELRKHEPDGIPFLKLGPGNIVSDGN